ncbi:hypothetical protein D9M72_591150 [compost metagenome]
MAVEAGHLSAGIRGTPGELLFHGLKALRAEQALEQFQPLGRLGAEKSGEVPLRQHDHPGELLTVHAQHGADFRAGFIVPAGLLDPLPVNAFAQQGVGLLFSKSVPAPGAGPVPRRNPGDFKMPPLG